MTNSKHTPGPWTLDTDGWKLTAAVRNEAGEHVALCRRDADAALIAAAPDLLAALKTALECIEWCRKHHDDPQSGSGFPVEVVLRAAIAKAEGRS